MEKYLCRGRAMLVSRRDPHLPKQNTRKMPAARPPELSLSCYMQDGLWNYAPARPFIPSSVVWSNTIFLI